MLHTLNLILLSFELVYNINLELKSLKQESPKKNRNILDSILFKDDAEQGGWQYKLIPNNCNSIVGTNKNKRGNDFFMKVFGISS